MRLINALIKSPKNTKYRIRPRNLWKTLRNVTKPQPRVDNNVVPFNDGQVANTKKCADLINQQFSKHTQTYDRYLRKSDYPMEWPSRNKNLDKFSDAGHCKRQDVGCSNRWNMYVCKQEAETPTHLLMELWNTTLSIPPMKNLRVDKQAFVRCSSNVSP